MTAFGIDYTAAARQEFICHIDGLVHIAAGVAAQINNHFLRTLHTQFKQSVEELLIGVTGKFANAYISGLWVDEVSRVN